ncbi:hypothetical protein FKW77_010309 [Venturia effusa]|uniref:R3H-associated N-terminal domain-containing protein n=1 Tax=Venturia effusa TaxID=50376 RepID=A0A517L2C2_9PEZI|nr:hypothetical protein FKW77_010309 [Venturia effusa]
MAIPRPARFEVDQASTTVIDVASWTQEALKSLDLNASVRGTSVALAIPLDDASEAEGQPGISAGEAVRAGHVLRRKSSNRDSLRHRETLLKGKEGSRQRRRWENDRLLGNPHAQPPQPSDWQIRPTHPVHSVPYYLAPLWDAGYAKQNAARKEREQRAKKSDVGGVAAAETAGKVPKELRQKLKRSKAAKGMLQDLEKEVRSFVEKWEIKCKRMAEDGIIEPDSEEEDEIVFIGRNGEMHDMPSSPRSSDEILELQREKLVFDSLEGDLGASFGRWLVHSLGQYYGLNTFSVTVGQRREAYVAVKEVRLKTGRRESFVKPLPRPLWAMV